MSGRPSPRPGNWAPQHDVSVGIEVLSVDVDRPSDGRAMAAALQSSLTQLLHERPITAQRRHPSHYDLGDVEIPPLTGRTPDARGRALAHHIHERLHSWHA